MQENGNKKDLLSKLFSGCAKRWSVIGAIAASSFVTTKANMADADPSTPPMAVETSLNMRNVNGIRYVKFGDIKKEAKRNGDDILLLQFYGDEVRDDGGVLRARFQRPGMFEVVLAELLIAYDPLRPFNDEAECLLVNKRDIKKLGHDLFAGKVKVEGKKRKSSTIDIRRNRAGKALQVAIRKTGCIGLEL